MRFHFPSFMIGFVAGASAKALAPRIRPVLVELATAGYRVVRAVGAHAARRREDFEDLLAEARARAAGAPGAEAPSN